MCVGNNSRGRHIEERQFQLTLKGCVVSACCVGFASFDVVCDELLDCAWNVGLSQHSD